MKAVDVAVHHRRHGAGDVAGAVVLDHLVRLEDVGADLVAPGNVALLAVEPLALGFLLVLLNEVKLGLEHLHGQLAVPALGALHLARHDHPGRHVMRAARRFPLC